MGGVSAQRVIGRRRAKGGEFKEKCGAGQHAQTIDMDHGDAESPEVSNKKENAKRRRSGNAALWALTAVVPGTGGLAPRNGALQRFWLPVRIWTGRDQRGTVTPINCAVAAHRAVRPRHATNKRLSTRKFCPASHVLRTRNLYIACALCKAATAL